MKTLLLLILFPAIGACTSVKGNRNTGEFSLNSFGSDAKKLKLTPDGFEVEGLNQSKALKNVTDTVKGMWTNYLMAEGLKYLADKYYTQEGNVVSSAETVKLEELRNAKSAADAEAALETLKATHAAEAAAAVPPP